MGSQSSTVLLPYQSSGQTVLINNQGPPGRDGTNGTSGGSGANIALDTDGVPYYSIPDTTAPSVPTGLAGTPGNTTAALTWSASTDNVAVTGYKVRRGGTVVGTPSGTSFTDTGLTNGTTYSYTVSAVDGAGNESAQTSVVTVTPAVAPDTTPPSTPGTPTATGGNTTASVAFTGSTDNVAVVGYRVYASTDSYTAIAASGASSPISVTGLTNGTAVTFKVAAYDAAGNVSTKSAASNSVTPAAPPTTILSDNFNRADAGTVGAPQIGPTPTESNTWIRSNQMQLAASSSSIQWAMSAANYTIQFTFAATTGATPNWRYTDTNNRYSINPGTGGVQKRVGGAFTALGTLSATPAVGDVLKIVASGSTHTIFINGTQVFTFTDAANATGDLVFLATNAGDRIDDLTVTTP